MKLETDTGMKTLTIETPTEMNTSSLDKIVERLEVKMVSTRVAVSRDKNPMVIGREQFSRDQKIYMLGQYSLFPKNIISFLVASAYTLGYHGWTEVVEELRDNINEELGAGYVTISDEMLPHYSILRKSIKEGLNIDVGHVSPSLSTTTFITKMQEISAWEEPAMIVGAMYALEATAVPELKIVREFTSSVFGDFNQTMPKLLDDFFKFHIQEIEVEHRNRLLKTIGTYCITENQELLFVKGFNTALDIMDNWWLGMQKEAEDDFN